MSEDTLSIQSRKELLALVREMPRQNGGMTDIRRKIWNIAMDLLFNTNALNKKP